MKKIIVFLCVLLSSVYLSAREDPVILHNGGSVNDRYDLPMPADMPDVYYNNVSQTIIIDGTGEVEYYDVEIMSLTTFDVLISTQVNGYYDTIDISSLPDGEYVITIDAPTGNSFEGFFEIY